MIDVNSISKRANVSIVDGKLQIGNRIVKDVEVKEGTTLVPQYYAIRYFKDNWWHLCTTLDLTEQGIWLCGGDTDYYNERKSLCLPSAIYTDFSTVEHLLNNVLKSTKGKDWQIFRDDDFMNIDTYEATYGLTI